MALTTFENFPGVITYDDLVGFSINVASTVTQYSANIGDDSNSTITLDHNLNSYALITAVKENSSGNIVFPDIIYSNSNTIILNFVAAPTANQYTIYIK